MKKYKVEVTKTWDFEVEIDETVWTEKNIAEWKKVFYDANTLEEIVEILAIMFAEEGEGKFLEGFGVPMIDNSIPFPYMLTAERCKQVAKDISINAISEDIEADVSEL